MTQTFRVTPLVFLTVFASAPFVFAQSPTGSQARNEALGRLQAAQGSAVQISEHKATGAARFIRVLPGSARGLGAGPATTAREKEQQSMAFFREYGSLVGISDPLSLRLASSMTDALGETHLTWRQFHGRSSLRRHHQDSLRPIATAQGGDRHRDTRHPRGHDTVLDERTSSTGGAGRGGRRPR